MTTPETPDQFPLVLITLMKGVLYRESDPTLWQSLMGVQARVRDYVGIIGLEMTLDEAEGYAFLRHRPLADGVPELPRLVPRRQLGYTVSLLLTLLRKKLAEFDATSSDTRLILGRDDIVELVRVFMPETSNEARVMDRLDTHLTKIVEMGFLRRLQGRADHFEVQRILKTFVDAQWLQTLDQRLADYHAHLTNAHDELTH